MYIKTLDIIKGSTTLRTITFHKGINLIIDATKNEDDSTTSGNGVGKTTLLKLIDYCFGAEPSTLYSDNERINDATKRFFENHDITLRLKLGEFDRTDNEITIERNVAFKNSKNSLPRINGTKMESDKDFKEKLRKLLFPNAVSEKPTLRQIIPHYIRYNTHGIENALNYLKMSNAKTNEALILFFLGVALRNTDQLSKLEKQLANEKSFLSHLETERNLGTYKAELELAKSKLADLENQKSSLRVDPDLGLHIQQLSELEGRISTYASELNSLYIKKRITLETITAIEEELRSNGEIDALAIEALYEEAKCLNITISHNFADLLSFQKEMSRKQIDFIKNGLQQLDMQIKEKSVVLSGLKEEEALLANTIRKGDVLKEIERISSEIGKKHQEIGSLERSIDQIVQSENKINEIKTSIRSGDEYLYSEEAQKNIQTKENNFNLIFSEITEALYGEKYMLTHNLRETKNKTRCYHFEIRSNAYGSGKIQGEVLAFDLAYLKYAKDNDISSLSFTLNDKKELMDDVQLTWLSEYVKTNDCQIIFPILRDKAPEGWLKEENVILELSQNDKLLKF